MTFAPGDDALTAAAWVWPPALLIVVTWSYRRMRASMPGRTRWLIYPVLGVLSLASVGALVNNVALLRDDVTEAMPGALYDVGGHSLHLHCTGFHPMTNIFAGSADNPLERVGSQASSADAGHRFWL